MSNQLPLVVDLDGTLLLTDTLHESALNLLHVSPHLFLMLPIWLARSKAHLKEKLAHIVSISPDSLPYNDEFLVYLRAEKSNGRILVLCTAADRLIANRVADFLKIFDEVIASDGVENLAGTNKAKVLERRFEKNGFDYAGNSSADFPVWASAKNALVVNASSSVLKKACKKFAVVKVFKQAERDFNVWHRLLRTHQWLKNILLFVPLIVAHQLSDPNGWHALILAFFSFSLCASSVYIVNDLLDLESDRIHPFKRIRPLASGLVPIWIGVVLSPVLLAASFSLAYRVGIEFSAWLTIYFAITCIYSFVLKRLILIDCLTLAVLYTLRIVAGAATVQHKLSFWLLAFSFFIFLSLAFVKRYAELEALRVRGIEKAHGRGYLTSDTGLIQNIGISSGQTAVLVFALYLNSDAVIKLYQRPEVIWGAIPVVLFWINWMWMQANRGKMHDDPLVFAIKDPFSLAAAVVVALIIVAATVS
jgi:4-hydroxybenzoate polyprenyltransferase